MCRGFGGAEIKDWETKSMLSLCHRHRKKFIQKWYSRNHWSKMTKVVSVERKRSEAYKDKKRYKEEIRIRIWGARLRFGPIWRPRVMTVRWTWAMPGIVGCNFLTPSLLDRYTKAALYGDFENRCWEYRRIALSKDFPIQLFCKLVALSACIGRLDMFWLPIPRLQTVEFFHTLDSNCSWRARHQPTHYAVSPLSDTW